MSWSYGFLSNTFPTEIKVLEGTWSGFEPLNEDCKSESDALVDADAGEYTQVAVYKLSVVKEVQCNRKLVSVSDRKKVTPKKNTNNKLDLFPSEVKVYSDGYDLQVSDECPEDLIVNESLEDGQEVAVYKLVEVKEVKVVYELV